MTLETPSAKATAADGHGFLGAQETLACLGHASALLWCAAGAAVFLPPKAAPTTSW